jgi:GMP synthase (glutamine-hydrolysing)
LADDLLIVLDGPMSIHEQSVYPFFETEMSIILERLTHGKSVMGIYLGAQVMVAALGAKVASTTGAALTR